jgi:hypothetical protein
VRAEPEHAVVASEHGCNASGSPDYDGSPDASGGSDYDGDRD